MMKTNSIYIHWPFCKKRCYYCDFTTFANSEEYIFVYTNALMKEIKNAGEKWRNTPYRTLFFGGGTPSYIKGEYLIKIKECIDSTFPSNLEEFTVELNPRDVNYELIQVLKEMKVNRISLGIQTFKDNILNEIGRDHNSYIAEESIYKLVESGFDNISIDLMTGLPGQEINDGIRDAKKAMSLPIKHLSLYGLIISKGTIMAKKNEEKPELFPDDGEERELFHKMREIFLNDNFNHYEIANFSKKGFESKHNLNYWHLNDYLGFGLSAVSFINDTHISNTNDLRAYINGCNKQEIEVLNKKELYGEIVLMGLRLKEGLDFKKLEERTSINIRKEKTKEIKHLVEQGFIKYSTDKISLTLKGQDFSNFVIRELFLD